MPLFLPMAAYICGLLAAHTFAPPPWHPAFPALLGATWLALRHSRARVPLLTLLLLSCGYSNYHLQSTPPQRLPTLSSLPDTEPLTFYGRVRRVSSRPEGGKRLDLRIHHVLRNRHPTPVAGNLRLYLEHAERAFAPDEELAFRATLRMPRRFGTPGEFDSPRHLAASGLQASAYVPNADGVVRLSSHGPSLVTRLRGAAGDLIDRTLPKPASAALVRALTLGDKEGLSDRQRRRLAHLGLSHLFSISGFHLGLIASFGYALLLTLVRRSETLMLALPPRRLLPLVLLPLLWGYLQLTGQAMPTLRAWLAAAVVASLLWMRRRCRPVDAALAVAAAILAATPMALFTPSFQLSFAGLFGILILVPRWSRWLPSRPLWRRRLLQMLLITPAATLATCPVVLWHFHILAPAGLPANLIAGLIIGWLAIPAGLAGVLLAPAWPVGAAACFQATGTLIELTLQLCEQWLRFGILTPRYLYLSRPSLVFIALAAAVLLWPPRKWKRPVMCALLAAAWLWPAPNIQTLQVRALSVGQGDALLASDAAGHHYLIDGGGSAYGTFDPGERLVAPALGRYGIKELTAVVLSHDHPDHRNGLLHVLRHFQVHSFWCALPARDLWPPLRRLLEERHIPIRTFAPGWTVVNTSPQQEIAVFVPRQNAPVLNDRSLVFYVRHEGAGALLTGDLEEGGVRQLLTATRQRPVSLLKLPHHGSRNGGADLLLRHFRPTTVFACLGYRNRFGFPHAETVASLTRRGRYLWRTDLHGTLTFTATAAGWHVRSWQRGVFR